MAKTNKKPRPAKVEKAVKVTPTKDAAPAPDAPVKTLADFADYLAANKNFPVTVQVNFPDENGEHIAVVFNVMDRFNLINLMGDGIHGR